MNLKELKDKTILLLGKSRAFSEEEFLSQMKHYNISITKEYTESVTLVVEGRMMTPYEQNFSDELYEKKVATFIEIDNLERMLAAEIDDNTLLMSLKLSNNRERLKSFLQNACINDRLYFKLLQMYQWSGEDFFENDDNRDVTAALISRFYQNIERNHNVQYATTGLIHLIRQTENEKLLEAIAALEPLQFHPKIIVELVTNKNTPKSVLKRFLKLSNREALEAISYNENLDSEIVQELIQESYFAKIVAQNIKLTNELFDLLWKYKENLANNESLTLEMQMKLLASHDEDVLEALAQNRELKKEIIIQLLEMQNQDIKASLFANSATPQEFLQEAFVEELYHKALAQNSNTPKEILEALFEGGNRDILEQIAANEATPVEILYQLQLDSRFDRAVKTNRAFGKHIQSENIGWLV